MSEVRIKWSLVSSVAESAHSPLLVPQGLKLAPNWQRITYSAPPWPLAQVAEGNSCISGRGRMGRGQRDREGGEYTHCSVEIEKQRRAGRTTTKLQLVVPHQLLSDKADILPPKTGKKQLRWETRGGRFPRKETVEKSKAAECAQSAINAKREN